MSNSNERLSEVKLYEIATEAKKNKKENREEINKFYTSISAAIIPVIPFMYKISDPLSFDFLGHKLNWLFLLLPTIGIIISINWILVLKRLAHELIAVDRFLMSIEQKHEIEYVQYLEKFLDKINSPNRVVVQEMTIPYAFLVIFTLGLLIAMFGDLTPLNKVIPEIM